MTPCSLPQGSQCATALHSRKHDREVQLYAFDIMALDLRHLPLSMRKTNLARLLARRPDGIFVAPFEQGNIGPQLFEAACRMGLEGLVSKAQGSAVSRRSVEALDQGEEPDASGDAAGDGGVCSTVISGRGLILMSAFGGTGHRADLPKWRLVTQTGLLAMARNPGFA